jgi:hypothetical protein
MSTQAAVIELRATTDKLGSDFKAAAVTVQNFAGEVKATGAQLGATFGGGLTQAVGQTNGAFGGLLGTLKEFRREQVQQGRQARFLVNELAAVIPVGDGAKQMMEGFAGVLIEGAAGGLSFGLALEAVKLVMQLVTAESVAAEEAAKKFWTQITKMRDESAATADEVRKINLEVAGFTPAMVYAAESVKPAEMAFSDLTDAVERQRQALALLRKEEIDSLGATGTSNTEGEIKKAEARLQELETQLAAMEALLAARKAKFKAMVGKEEKEGFKPADFEPGSDMPTARSMLPEFKPYGERIEFKPQFGINWEKVLADQQHFVEETKKAAEKTKEMWVGVGQAIGTALGAALSGLITGTMKAGDAMKALAKTVIDTARQMITSYILSAEAAAAFSQAGIPVIGPALAVAAVATVAGMLSGLLGGLPSAATGWDRVPFDQPVMVHQGERIVPKYDADRLDRLEAGAGGITLNVTTMDSKSFDQYLERNEGVLLRRLAAAARNRRTA